MEEHIDAVTLAGNPVTLLGNSVSVGDEAPDFTVVDGEWQPVTLRDFAGRTVLINAVPSLDTSVCSLQTKRFNEEAARLPENVAVLTISQDLPFAQSRFCSTEGVDRVQVLSDHVESEFGRNYGVLIEGMRLLARSVWVIDSVGKVTYKEVVPEVTAHPDYDAALAAAREAAG
jgi:thiol peroxidase